MFRAIAGLVFIVLVLPLAALIASLVMRLLDVSGIPGFMVGFPVFIGLLAGSVMILAVINDRINDQERFHKTHGKTHTNGVH